MDVSIIMVNYNTFALTKAAIESVFEKTDDIVYELILVDNNSPDGSGLLLKDYFGEKIVYVQSDENIGFGRANNLGIKQAKGRNIFLLNSDTILLNNAVKILSDYLDANPKVGICGGNLYDENGCFTNSFGRYLPSILMELNNLFGGLIFKIFYGKNAYTNRTIKPLRVACISGADMMLRASILNIVGGFDPDFFMYYEETELTYRIKKLGFSIYSVPRAQIIHLESRSFSDNYKKAKMYLDSHKLYYKKTHGRFERKFVRLIFLLTVFSRLFLFKLSRNTIKYNYWHVFLQNF